MKERPCRRSRPPLVARAGFPPLFALLIATLVGFVPIELGHLFLKGKKPNGVVFFTRRTSILSTRNMEKRPHRESVYMRCYNIRLKRVRRSVMRVTIRTTPRSSSQKRQRMQTCEAKDFSRWAISMMDTQSKHLQQRHIADGNRN